MGRMQVKKRGKKEKDKKGGKKEEGKIRGKKKEKDEKR